MTRSSSYHPVSALPPNSYSSSMGVRLDVVRVTEPLTNQMCAVLNQHPETELVAEIRRELDLLAGKLPVKLLRRASLILKSHGETDLAATIARLVPGWCH